MKLYSAEHIEDVEKPVDEGQLIEKDTPTQMISYEFRKIFKSTFFTKHLRMSL